MNVKEIELRKARHFDEQGRLAAVYELKILDTPKEDRYDKIVRLATEFFDVPIAFVSILEKDRQWFKSERGLNLKSIPREGSLCNVTIQKSHPVIVPDTHLDSRFANNPYVLGNPHMRFYAGIPLATPEGYNVGTFCLSDSVPRIISDSQRDFLIDLASVVEDQLTLFEVIQLERKYRLTNIALEKTQKSLQLRNDFIRKAFSSYMSDEVVNRLINSPSQLAVGGEKRTVTVIFSDLRGFTQLSEELPAEKVFSALNNYFAHMTAVIEKHGGMVDSFIGDAIMVVFGAPQEREHDALRAVACALEMQLALKDVNAINQQQGLPELAMGIGVNTGMAVVGNIGSEKRLQYSAIGSPVNLASRIQDLTIGGQVLISEATRQAAGEHLEINGHLRVKVKGVAYPITIYDINGVKGEYKIHL